MVDLYWRESEDGKNLYLQAGLLVADLASLTKRNVWWEGWIWLEGAQLPKRYAPLEIIQPQIEQIVRNWFGLAMTDRPAQDQVSEENLE